MYNKEFFFYGTGRRKSSVARVRVYKGTGKIIINSRNIDEYFVLETLKLIVRQPLVLTETQDQLQKLKKAGFLTRDPRMKERKKYGLKAARRAPQFSKR